MRGGRASSAFATGSSVSSSVSVSVSVSVSDVSGSEDSEASRVSAGGRFSSALATGSSASDSASAQRSFASGAPESQPKSPFRAASATAAGTKPSSACPEKVGTSFTTK